MTEPTRSPGLWVLAWRRLLRDRAGLVSLVIVLFYLGMVLLSAMGWIARDWTREVGVNYAPPPFWADDQDETAKALPPPAEPATPPSLYGLKDPLGSVLADIRRAYPGDLLTRQTPRRLTLPLGGDKWGHDVLTKLIKGSQTSLLVGLVAALLATALGTVLGALAGYFGGWVDDALNWLFGVFTAIPYLLLVFAIAAVLQERGVTTLILILGLTGWTGVFRLMRAEFLKHRSREYVLAAAAMGASHARRMFVHILPNTSHVILVQLSLNVVGFIKSEVILSFLGFGVPVDVVSWGSMLNEAQNELVLGKWWQLAAAGTAMAILVTAFSMLTDALRDALDPRLQRSGD